MAKQMGLNMKETKNGNGANLGFEAKLWTAADKRERERKREAPAKA
jgi:hypothetical protein